MITRSTDQPVISATSARGRWLVAACVLATSLAGIDATVTSIALPAIGTTFNAPFSILQWTVTGYTLTLASLILLGGAAGDRYGRRRVMELGIVWFALASLACAFAPSAWALVAARTLQGVGAALLTPASLAIIEASITPDDRPRAIGTWAAFSGVAAAIAPFVGGWLIQGGTWRWVFLINPPLAAAVFAISRRHIPESHDRSAAGQLDIAGALLATAALGGLTYAVIAAPTGPTPQVITSAGLGVAALAAFIVAEARSRHPMLPLRLLRSPLFTSVNLVTFLVYAALGGFFFLVVVVLQNVAGFSPLLAGAALLPTTVMLLALSGASGALAQRIGPRTQMTIGPAVCALGLAMTLGITPNARYVQDVLPGITVLGAGLATMVAPLTATALAAAPADKAGIASGVNNAVARTASLLAVAGLPVLAGLAGDAYTKPLALLASYRTSIWICIGLLIAGSLTAATAGRTARAKWPSRN